MGVVVVLGLRQGDSLAGRLLVVVLAMGMAQPVGEALVGILGGLLQVEEREVGRCDLAWRRHAGPVSDPEPGLGC